MELDGGGAVVGGMCGRRVEVQEGGAADIHGLSEGVGREAPVAAMAARARGRSCRREQPKEGVGAGGEAGRGELRVA